MSFSQQFAQKGAKQRAAGLFHDPFKGAPDPFKAARGQFDNVKFHNPFPQQNRLGSFGSGGARPAAPKSAAPKPPAKKLSVPAPNASSKGAAVATALKKSAPPKHAPLFDPAGGETLLKFVEWVLNGAIRAGEMFVLVIIGVGEVIVTATDQMIQAARQVGTTIGTAIAGGPPAIIKFLNDHGKAASVAILAAAILTAIVLSV
jgi:hypothetical protein